MILNNLKLIPDNFTVNIETDGSFISNITENKITDNHQLQLIFNDAIVFPGLINSHDHLEFNSFPLLGDRVYNNYIEWGHFIHATYKDKISKILAIPEALRVNWGIYKNLLCGVTTVVNHGKYHTIKNPVIKIIQSVQNVHSIKFEKNWRRKLNNPLKKNIPFIIHAGEGTDEQSKQEIDKLIKWNFLNRKLIAVHGIAMNELQSNKFKALVWCPASNYFLLNKTAPIDKLKNNIKILLGTDSTLTGDWNIWNHIRMAKGSGLATNMEIFEMVNKNAADVWNLNSGALIKGKAADIVIAKSDHSINFPENFYSLNPDNILMVIQDGNIVLFDEEILKQLQLHNFSIDDFSKYIINDKIKFNRGNLPGLIKQIRHYCDEIKFPVKLNDPDAYIN